MNTNEMHATATPKAESFAALVRLLPTYRRPHSLECLRGRVSFSLLRGATTISVEKTEPTPFRAAPSGVTADDDRDAPQRHTI